MLGNESSRTEGAGPRSAKAPSVGVCVLKVEQQEEYLLITVTTNRHLGRSLTFARPETTKRYADPADALRAAERFLDSFT